MNSDNSNWDDIRRGYERSEFDPDNGGDGDADCSDLDFNYNDTDTHPNEIAELYSYTENIEFQHNLKAFEIFLEESTAYQSNQQSSQQWQKFSADIQKRIVLSLLNQLDSSQQKLRIKAARCILYIAQGCFAEVISDEEQKELARHNVMKLYEWGTFTAFVELLNLEIENSFTAANIAKRKVAISIADSVDLRIILSVLYIITEVIRSESQIQLTQPPPAAATNNDSDDNVRYKHIVENFIEEINQPFGDELLTVKLLGLVTRFCNGTAPHIPIKKVLLLLWKISLVGLGGMETLKQLKKQYRSQNDLSPSNEDTLEIARCMRASSPPPLAADILTDNPNTKRNRPFRRGIRTNDIYRQESLMKQTSLDEQGLEIDAQQNEGEEDISDYYRPYEDPGYEGKKKTKLNEKLVYNFLLYFF